VPSTSPDRQPGSKGSLALPLVIVIHGGGFTTGSRVAFVGQFLEMLAAAGYPWASIDYRLGGPARAAEAVNDVQAAVAFARCHAEELGIDSGRIVLLGEDAGAALAAHAATGRPPGVVAAILIGGLYAGVPPITDRPSEGGTRPQPAAPRVLVVHGTADTEVRLSEAEAWCAPAVTDDGGCELLRVEGASHRAENWWPVQWDYKRRVIRWLNDVAPVARHDNLQPGPLHGVTVLPAGLHKRIPYAHQETDLARPTPSESEVSVLHTLDAWLPRDRSRPGPAVVLLHGGGWEAGDRVTYITPLFAPLAEAAHQRR
jgi:predicted esterase